MAAVEATGIVLVMLLAVVASRFIARVTRLPAPLVQIALGAAIYYSSLSSVALDPQVFFLLLLPPLLFLDGWRIPKDELLRNAGTVLRLALGLVVFTVLGLGLLVHWLIPALPLPVAFALAAVVAPTDPVALGAIAARTPIPTRMRHILEGESLFNDASGLVCLRFAVAAALTGAFSLPDALASFAWVALGGLAIGTAVTWLVTRSRASATALVGHDGAAQILLTLLIPSGVYLLAESVHVSGILAVVAAGITMGFAPHTHWQATTRIRRTAVWETVQFAANGSIFVLLGEQIPSILAAAPRTVLLTGHHNPWWLGVYVAGIVVALAGLRFAWVWVSLRHTFSSAGSGAPPRSWRLVMAMSLAGVRGAITLAGVLTLPLSLGDGTPLVGRELAIFLAAGVIVLSLLLASLALPPVLRGLQLPPDPSQRAAEHRVRTAAAEAALRAVVAAGQSLAAGRADAGLYLDASTRIADLYRHRVERYGGDDRASSLPGRVDGIERQLRLVGLKAEREELIAAGRAAGIRETTVGRLVREIDLQEARHGA